MVQDVRRALRRHQLAALFGAARGDDCQPRSDGQLDGGEADASRPAMHQHGLSGPRLRPIV